MKILTYTVSTNIQNSCKNAKIEIKTKYIIATNVNTELVLTQTKNNLIIKKIAIQTLNEERKDFITKINAIYIFSSQEQPELRIIKEVKINIKKTNIRKNTQKRKIRSVYMPCCEQRKCNIFTKKIKSVRKLSECKKYTYTTRDIEELIRALGGDTHQFSISIAILNTLLHHLKEDMLIYNLYLVKDKEKNYWKMYIL